MELIVLAAGRGTRMGQLTEEVPKPLVEITPGRSILAQNLVNLRSSGTTHRVLVIGGHCWRHIEAFVEEWAAVENILAIRNEDYMIGGPLRSVRVGLEAAQGGQVAILNGDTLFDAQLLERAAAPLGRGGHVFVSRQPQSEDDDMVVTIEGWDPPQVVAASKGVAGVAPIVSSGLLVLQDQASVALAHRVVSDLIAEEACERRAFTWHRMLREFHAQNSAVRPHFVPRDWWHEFDTHANIDSFRARRMGADPRLKAEVPCQETEDLREVGSIWRPR